jgi:hypothetical protein
LFHRGRLLDVLYGIKWKSAFAHTRPHA